MSRRAKQLLAEAGYPDGFEIENIIVSNPAPYTEVVGPAFLAQLKETLNITGRRISRLSRGRLKGTPWRPATGTCLSGRAAGATRRRTPRRCGFLMPAARARGTL